MTTYIIRRLLQGIVVLFLATFLIYSIILITPGGPQDQVNNLRYAQSSGQEINPRLLELLLKQYGLDKPYPINYLAWLFDPTETTDFDRDTAEVVPKGIDLFGVIKGSGVLTGDFGESASIAQGDSVLGMMGQRIGNTLALTVLATLVSIIIALPLGIISAIKQYSRLDYAVTGFSFVGLAMPSFWLGLMLIIFMAVLPKTWRESNGWQWLPFLPPGDTYDSQQEDNILNRIYHLVLPVSVLAFIQIASLSRFVRASMLEVLRQDYVRTAWAKGLSQRVVIIKHALRNALIPVITIITLSLPGLFSGAIITETVFAYFGMGRLYFQAVQAFDIPLVMGFLLIITSLIILSNILADILYAVADPRIRFS
jgi:peptide/nickel transport system permease protein